jgi:predicted negative regulator of RcsB-dependent stress response
VEVYQSETEQVEAIKKFWKENGKSIIAGILIGFGILFSWQAWQENKNKMFEAASMEYMALMDNIAQGNSDAAIEHGSRITGQYSDTTYASMASLALANLKLEKDDSLAARAHLKWVVTNAGMDSIKHVARIRLARLILSEGNADEALTVVSNVQSESFRSLYDELLGDIYLTMDKKEEARKAYVSALSDLEEVGTGRVNLLRMKLDDLGVNTDQIVEG